MNLDMSNPPNSRTKDFFSSPALSLSLAGVFRGATGAVEEVEEGDEESGGGREEAVDISSENTGPGRSDEDADAMELQEEEVDERGKKKRKKYHRHTAEQIREMETLFKESPHPDEKQRQQLSKKLGLNPRQVKFWFQNRRTQIKAIQERHENSLLKTEMEKLREENKCMRQTIKKACCPNCGFATSNKDSTMMTTGEQQLRIENARLKAEVEKLRTTIGKFPGGTTSPSSSCSGGNDQENRSSLDFYTGFFGLEKSRISEIANQAMNELTKMATAGDPLWVRSVETGWEILNYDEYAREFLPEGSSSGSGRIKRSIEASRETGVVFLDMPRLVQAFMDVNQWKEMFSCMVAKAATVDVISNGEGDNRNCAIQLMFAELQMLTPLVTTREVYFIRQCKQLSPDSWAIVDVSIDRVEDNTDTSVGKCRKRPSGCIIQDKCNGHCKVIWVEHLECQKATVHTLFRSLVNSGLAFGAKHWMATLQLQCERLVFFMATNVPTKDSSGALCLVSVKIDPWTTEMGEYNLTLTLEMISPVLEFRRSIDYTPMSVYLYRIATLAGRKSVLKLAQRMTSSFSRAIGASSYHTWTKISTKGGDGIKVASRRNMNDPGEPQGLILCAVSSIWLPVSPHALFDFLRDDARWNEWDIMLTGGQVQTIANLAKGQDRGNSVTLHATKSKETNLWILQDSCTNAFESMVVRAAVDITGMQSVMTGVDSSNIAILSSGFSILPDGLETRPLVISSRPEERSMEGGSLLTVAFQILANPSPTAKLTTESMETTNTLISCTLQNIKTSLQCEDS